jgi:hypothetical protein
MSTTLGSTVAAMRTKAACRVSAGAVAAGAGLAVPAVATGAAVEFLADVHAAVSPGHRKAATSATDVERCIAVTVSVRDGSPHPVAA